MVSTIRSLHNRLIWIQWKYYLYSTINIANPIHVCITDCSRNGISDRREGKRRGGKGTQPCLMNGLTVAAVRGGGGGAGREGIEGGMAGEARRGVSVVN